MRYKFLQINEDTAEAVLLGYRLPLTKSEYRVLGILSHSLSVGKGMSTAELIGAYSDQPLRPSNITVHICAINRKSRAIGGRNLLVFRDGKYYFNEYM